MKKTIFGLITPMILAATIAVGCNGVPGKSQTAGDKPADATTASTNADGSALPFANKDKVEAAKPMAAAEITLPAGTAVTVRLQNSVSSAASHAGDRFDAVLDAPLVVNGKTIAPAGANVVGRVV